MYAKSVFDFSIRKTNMFRRNCTQFTALLRTQSTAAKRCDLTERTGLRSVKTGLSVRPKRNVRIWLLPIVGFWCLTWSLCFRLRLPKHFKVSDKCGLLFYYLKIGFLEYLRVSSEMRYTNGPIGHWKSWKSGKKPVLWMLGLLSESTIVSRRDNLVKKVPVTERLPCWFNIVEHR